ncbi:MAG: 3-phosphoshikimate 1-carboxyvinyltransferase [Salibacteraceae bacterium]
MKISAPKQILNSLVEVPTSKSISNRLLIINALSGAAKFTGLSLAEDTQILEKSLGQNHGEINIGHAGTAFRFLTSFLSIQKGEFVLTGSKRMQQRPIGPLVNALNSIGAQIEYLGKEGYPPLKITGTNIQGGILSIDAGISSQFISSLMLVAPYMSHGLTIELKGDIVSTPYLKMTSNLMKANGTELNWNNNGIKIASGKYSPSIIEIEKDWSSIAFWYEFVAISKIPQLLIKDVKQESIQGDSQVQVLFIRLGVESEFTPQGLVLRFSESLVNKRTQTFDLLDCPDLSQPLIVTLAALGINARVKGLTTLKNKETNRSEALKTELAKFGVKLEVTDDEIILTGTPIKKYTGTIETYEDHRMAMAFAPLSVLFGELKIVNPEVVSKSYPEFWGQLEGFGFKFSS